jgi:hypothetical protein
MSADGERSNVMQTIQNAQIAAAGIRNALQAIPKDLKFPL